MRQDVDFDGIKMERKKIGRSFFLFYNRVVMKELINPYKEKKMIFS